MWYVYLRDDSWEQGVTVASKEEAEAVVAENPDILKCQYVG